jgi:GAF domain-containing protein
LSGKSAVYTELATRFAGLMEGEPDVIANAANLAALIYHGLPDLNWAGFYFARDGELVLRAVPGQAGLRAHRLGQGRLRHGRLPRGVSHRAGCA